MDRKLSFAELGVSKSIVNALSSQGIDEPTDIQSATIPEGLNGRDVCGKASTGSGKTLAFGIPLLQLSTKSAPQAPNALVLVPTRELALQVRNVLFSLVQANKEKKVWVEAFYGGVPIDRQIRSLRRGVDVLVATPGRLIDLLNRGALTLNGIERVVLDEADLMADLGFLPDVEFILSQIERDHQTMLFSATLDGYIEVLSDKYMDNPSVHEVKQPENRAELMSHHFFYVDYRNKDALLSKVTVGAERSLVFVRTRDGAETLARNLSFQGVEAELLTGAMKQSVRERVLKRFSAGKVQVLVATDVAARGLDISGLDLVVHYDLPDDEKAFVHRSGRTARGGKSGVVVSFIHGNQVRSLLRIQDHLGISEPILKVDVEDPALAGIAQGEKVSAPEYRVHPREHTQGSARRVYGRKSPSFSGQRRFDGGHRDGGSSFSGRSSRRNYR